jgi:1,5-anhydro-D-fructose reductase (1,5-anhydro-D-mannitol-forming)
VADVSNHRHDGPPVRWAVLGSSEFALDWVIPALTAASNADLRAVVTRDVDGLRRRWSVPHAVAVVAELSDLAGLDVEAVHVVAPNQLHAPLAIAACELGLNVLVEKPMAVTLDECIAMERAAEKNGVSLFVGCSMAWAPPVVASSNLVSQGLIGDVIYATISAGFDPPKSGWRQATPIESGGGPLFDLGSHAVDALLRILGPIAEVQAVADHHRHNFHAEDTVSMQLRFASGTHSHVHLSFAGAFNGLVLHGTEGRLESTEWLGRRFSGTLMHEVGRIGAARFTDDADHQRVELDLPTIDVLRAQADETSAAIRGGPAARNAARPAGLDVAMVLDAAVNSARSGDCVTVGKPT